MCICFSAGFDGVQKGNNRTPQLKTDRACHHYRKGRPVLKASKYSRACYRKSELPRMGNKTQCGCREMPRLANSVLTTHIQPLEPTPKAGCGACICVSATKKGGGCRRVAVMLTGQLPCTCTVSAETGEGESELLKAVLCPRSQPHTIT